MDNEDKKVLLSVEKGEGNSHISVDIHGIDDAISLCATLFGFFKENTKIFELFSLIANCYLNDEGFKKSFDNSTTKIDMSVFDERLKQKN